MSALTPEQRRRYVGSSEVAALFDASPWLTMRELYLIKRGELDPPDLGDDVRVLCGQEIEAAAARIFARIHGFRIRKVRRYTPCRITPGLGASLDYEIVGNGTSSSAILELKNTDAAQWATAWLRDPERRARHDEILRDVEPPLHVDLQCQTQLAASGREVAYIGVLVGGNRPYLVERRRHEATIGLIRSRVDWFWRCVRENRPPPLMPDDRRVMAALHALGNRNGEVLDLSADNYAVALAAEYESLRGETAEQRKRLDHLAAELMDRLGPATRARAGEWAIAWPAMHRKESVRTLPAKTYRGGLTVRRMGL